MTSLVECLLLGLGHSADLYPDSEPLQEKSMTQIGLFFGTTTGKTANIAEMIQAGLGGEDNDVLSL